MTEQIFLNIFILLVLVARWWAASPFRIKTGDLHADRVRFAHRGKGPGDPRRRAER